MIECLRALCQPSRAGGAVVSLLFVVFAGADSACLRAQGTIETALTVPLTGWAAPAPWEDWPEPAAHVESGEGALRIREDGSPAATT